jgi:glutaconyl-CoA/methylmalonyl-CoA decarboxylase subunit gamma
MRRYSVVVDGRTFTIDVEETAADRFEVYVGSLRFEASLDAEEDLPGAVISPEMPPPDEGRPPLVAPRAGELPPATPPAASPPPTTPPPAGRPAAPRQPAAHGGRTEDLTSPMPGVVLQVLVAPGSVLRRGDPILVLEAMKMRNTIRAPRPATVVEVAVEAGQPVGPGEPLVRLAPGPG